MKRAMSAILLAVGGLVYAQTAPTTQPQQQPQPVLVQPPTTRQVTMSSTTRPAQRSAEDMLRQMLQPANQGAQPLIPIPNEPPPVDLTSGPAAVAPGASTQPTIPDGQFLPDRAGRVTKSLDGKTLEFTMDSDGSAMSDAPMILLQNHKLQQLEDLVNNSYVDMKVRVSGDITEYRGRNYLLITRWSQVQDVTQPLK